MYLCIFMKKCSVVSCLTRLFYYISILTFHKIYKSKWDLQHLTSHLIRGNIYFFHKLFSELYYPQKSIKSLKENSLNRKISWKKNIFF